MALTLSFDTIVTDIAIFVEFKLENYNTVDYYTTAYRRSETNVAYGGATWRVMFLHIRYRGPRPIE